MLVRGKESITANAGFCNWLRCALAASIVGTAVLVCGLPGPEDFRALSRAAANAGETVSQAMKAVSSAKISVFKFFAREPDIAESADNVDGVGGASIPSLNETGAAPSEELAELANAQAISEITEEEGVEEAFIPPPVLLYKAYKTQKGDMVDFIARDQGAGLRSDTIISVNNITNTRALQQNKTLKIPNQDGILHTVSSKDTLDSIAKKYSVYGVDARSIAAVNELFSDKLTPGLSLFVPGARLDPGVLGEINGDLFSWPVSARRITSSYGYRTNPFTGKGRTFHTGLDIGAPSGATIRAAMYGKVTIAGWDNVFGNYVVIEHFNGYRTLYGHMSKISTTKGKIVQTGEVIGKVGSTGLSTGPHLHFGVYKNGKLTNPRTLLR